VDGIELLVRDHERLEALASELYGAEGSWAEATHRVLSLELEQHLALEEEVLLAEVGALGPLGAELAEEWALEHAELREAMRGLDDAAHQRQAAAELVSMLRVYARREEAELLPWFSTTAGAEAKQRLTAAIVERKRAMPQDHERTRLTADSNQPSDI
jgi:hypothetical protein